MTNEEAIKILEEMHDALQVECYKEFEENDVPALKMAISALREQEDHIREVTKKVGWISVNDRLPESDTRVLVWLKDGSSLYTQMDTDRIHLGRWARWGMYVTHWMPLPEPPEEEV